MKIASHITVLKLAEIVGYGNTCDAYHMTTPSPAGTGAAKAMKLAIEEIEHGSNNNPCKSLVWTV